MLLWRVHGLLGMVRRMLVRLSLMNVDDGNEEDEEVGFCQQCECQEVSLEID